MKTIKKNVNIFLLMTVVFVSSCLFSGCISQTTQSSSGKTATAEYFSAEYAFSAEMTLSKNTARLGETVEAFITFKNSSDKDLCVELPDWACYGNDYGQLSFEDSINFWVIKDIKYAYISIAVYPRCGVILEKDAVITCTKQFTVTERGINNAFLDIMFYAGASFCNCENRAANLWSGSGTTHECMNLVWMHSETIYITVR